MKPLLLFCALTAMFFSATAQNSLTEKERKDAVAFYNDATNNLKQQVNGLSEARLNWKPNDSTRSVAECIEHIALSEKNIADWAMETLKTPVEANKKGDKTDEDVKKMVESREKKVKTFDALKPKKQFGNAAQTLAEFEERRNGNIKFIETTTDGLKHHLAKTPLGTLDVYQILLLLNAHTIRHTAQIVEVKAMPGFPKK